jgi:hypothetical protein
MEMGELRVLFNTGSAESMGSVGEVQIDEAIYSVKESTLRMTPAVLETQLNTKVDIMLGADILTQFDFKLLPERKQIVFTSGEFHPYGYCSHFELYNGVPITPVSVFNRDMRFFFVTGSRRTYLNPSILQRQKPVGTAKDYYPGLGTFETPLYKVTVWVAGYDVELEVGATPAPLISMLNQTNSQGILGVDVLQGFEVCLAPRRRESIWWRLGSGKGEELEGSRRDPNEVPGYYY